MILHQRKGFLGMGRLAWLLGVALFFGAATLWAQSPDSRGAGVGRGAAPPAAAAPNTPGIDFNTGELPTIAKLFNTNPLINGIIAVLSVITLTLFLVFLITIQTRRMMPSAFVDEVTKLVLLKRYGEAADFCRNNRHIFAASIVQRCVENVDKNHSTLMNIVDNEGKRRADVLWSRVSFLVDLSTIAPMLGLLGTVLGMLQAFLVLPARSNSRLLAEAIGGAMSATFFGLIVAILAIVFYTIIRSRATSTLAEIEQSIQSIADHIKRGTE